MLSPHELATLMLVHRAPDQIDMARTEVDRLLDCHLIALDGRASHARRPVLTTAGAHVLQIAARFDGTRYDDGWSRDDDPV